MKWLIPTAVTFVLTACASQPDDIKTTYVSALQYRNYDCDQLSMEAEHISARMSDLYGSLKKTADNDAAQMGVGIILFWPTLFFLEGGDGHLAQEYSRLSGERDAIEKASIQKKCGIIFQPVAPQKKNNVGT